MRMSSIFLAGIAGLALAAGAPLSSQAQEGSSKSWGPKHTTFWSTDATGKYDDGKFMGPATQPMGQPTAEPTGVQLQMRQQRMYYQAPNKKVRAQMRLRQQQPGTRPGQPPTGAQPPSDVKPSAPPSGQPSQGEQPTQEQPPARGQTPQSPPPQGQPQPK